MDKPDAKAFMKQFEAHALEDETLSERFKQAETLARLSELSSRALLTELSNEWDTLGKSAAHLLVRALARAPQNPVAVRALIVSAYRCDVMSRMFEFIRDKIDAEIFTCSDQMLTEIQELTNKMLEQIRKEYRK
jgi:hypothetical protein